MEKYEDNKDKKIYNEDNKIYYVEVACESNEDTVCGSGNDNVCNVSSDIADEAVHMHDDGQCLVVEGHHDHLQRLHRGGGDLSDPLVEGEQQHQPEEAHAVSNQAGDAEHQGEVTQVGEEVRGDHGDGPGDGGGGERDQQHERVQEEGVMMSNFC